MGTFVLPLLLALGGNQPPVCDAGAVGFVECSGQITTVMLDGTASFDPEGGPLQYLWTEVCPNETLDDPTSPTPTLTIDMTGLCSLECGAIRLRVTDDQGASSSCTTAVLVEDTQPPMLSVPADRLELWTTGWPTQVDPMTNPAVGMATAVDVCSPNPTVTFTDQVVPGVPPSGIEQVVTRTWTATDFCGNQVSDTQVITIVGPSFFDPFQMQILPGRCPTAEHAARAAGSRVRSSWAPRTRMCAASTRPRCS